MSWYKSREDEPGYIEGQRMLNESDIDYQSRLTEMQGRYSRQIAEALNLEGENGLPHRPTHMNSQLIGFAIASVVLGVLLLSVGVSVSMILIGIIFGLLLNLLTYFIRRVW